MDDQINNAEKVELALLRAEHQKKFQVMIEYVKEKVGTGIEYRNDIVRVVVSDKGAYYELLDLPEEFSGVVGEHVERRFIAPSEAIATLTRAFEATFTVDPVNTRQFSILVLYTRRGIVDRKNCYIYDFSPTPDDSFPKPGVVGRFQPDVMPLFYKVKLDADFAKEIFGFNRGVAFCMANAGDRHLMVGIPYEGDHLVNLADLPTTPTIQ